jgi:hypothetical protein
MRGATFLPSKLVGPSVDTCKTELGLALEVAEFLRENRTFRRKAEHFSD